ncbi:MAG: Clp protease ClpP [Lentisphaeraceae bacterium]|nr:Clp protease ClpP [Lentisphaeraceae bacterium]
MKINKEKAWFSFKNTTVGKAILTIFGVIGWDVWMQQFSRDLRNLPEDTNDIEVQIGSEGGYITDGINIYNMLRMHSAKITTNIVSHAWSMGSIIAMAGDVRKMASNATFMIHNPWGYLGGDAAEMRHEADVLDTYKETLITTYQEATGLERQVISDMMDAETWLTAQEALDMGFITEIDSASEQAASYHGSKSDLANLAKEKFQTLNKKENPVAKKQTNKPEATAPTGAEEAAQNKKPGIFAMITGKAKLQEENDGLKNSHESEIANLKKDHKAELSRVREEAQNEAAEAIVNVNRQIFEACKTAGRTDLAGQLMNSGLSLEAAQKELQSLMAKEDGETPVASNIDASKTHMSSTHKQSSAVASINKRRNKRRK